MMKWILRIFLFLLWLVFSVIVGGLVLSVKDTLGINIFTSTGYHAFATCLVNEGGKAAHDHEKDLQLRELIDQLVDKGRKRVSGWSRSLFHKGE